MITYINNSCSTSQVILGSSGKDIFLFVTVSYVSQKPSGGRDVDQRNLTEYSALTLSSTRCTLYLDVHIKTGFPYQKCSSIWVSFCRAGILALSCHLFFLKQSLRVTKHDKIDLIFQLFLANWVFQTLETLFSALRKVFGVPCSTPVLALSSNFWVTNRALVRPNLFVTQKNAQQG